LYWLIARISNDASSLDRRRTVPTTAQASTSTYGGWTHRAPQ
ncbi:MAG: hypothetical protein QOG22_834, partial [Pseudonocardiales bacterium]|nr:hypothetical protein [Pseudonocardiales bacterium]